jgi:hypothetical protein
MGFLSMSALSLGCGVIGSPSVEIAQILSSGRAYSRLGSELMWKCV